MAVGLLQAWGYRWRSSRLLLVATVCIALFTETLLYGFLVPILPFMCEQRLKIDPSQTQRLTTALLGLHGITALIAAPIIAHFTDKVPGRQIPLIVSLGGCIVGTLLLAATPSLEALFVGRVLQGVAGSAAWIISMAMLADRVDPDHMGRMMGLTMSFVTTGMISGPTVAGVVLESLGYWAAWSVPLIALLLDVLFRLIIIEPPKKKPNNPTTEDNATPTGENTTPDPETAPLLSPTAQILTTTPNPTPEPPPDGLLKPDDPTPSPGFYRIMLRDIRVIGGLLNIIIYSSIITGFNATLPLHITRVFHWGTGSVGMIFFAMQVPAIFLVTGIGWLRDRVGIRWPTMIGWALLVPLLWLLGVPGAEQFPWARPEGAGKGILIACAIALGVVTPLVRGAGILQISAVASELEKKNPGIFGANGGNSRVFSIGEVCFNLAMIIGPLLAGSLSETVGFFYTNVAFAIIALAMAAACPYVFSTRT